MSFDYARYGRPGTAIPGSDLLRGYCPLCSEPIRMYAQKKAINGIEEIDHSEDAYIRDCSTCIGSRKPRSNPNPVTPRSERSYRGSPSPGEW